MKKKMKKASYTVEAACMMSVILLAVIGILYLFFFVHNRAWLTAAAYEAAISGSMEGVKADGKAWETAEMKGRELGNTGFFGAEQLQLGLETGKNVKVTYDLDTTAPYGGFRWHLKAEGSSAVVRPAVWIRRLKSASEVLSEIGG